MAENLTDSVLRTDLTGGSASARDKALFPYEYEVQCMMECFGDYAPLKDSAHVIHDIIKDQLELLLLKAELNAAYRKSNKISHEDILFLMRGNMPKVKRLLNYLKTLDARPNLLTAVRPTTEDVEKVCAKRGKRTKNCLDFFVQIEDCKEFTSFLNSKVEDEASKSRLMRKSFVSNRMNTSDYLDYSEKITHASFCPMQKKKEVFKNWVLENSIVSSDVSPLAMTIVEFLAKETVAELVDMAFLLRERKRSIKDCYCQQPLYKVYNMNTALIRTFGETTAAAKAMASDDAAFARGLKFKINKHRTHSSSNLEADSSLQPQSTSSQPQSTSLQPQSTSLQPQSTSLQPQSTSLQPQSISLPLLWFKNGVKEHQTMHKLPGGLFLHNVLQQCTESPPKSKNNDDDEIGNKAGEKCNVAGNTEENEYSSKFKDDEEMFKKLSSNETTKDCGLFLNIKNGEPRMSEANENETISEVNSVAEDNNALDFSCLKSDMDEKPQKVGAEDELLNNEEDYVSGVEHGNILESENDAGNVLQDNGELTIIGSSDDSEECRKMSDEENSEKLLRLQQKITSDSENVLLRLIESIEVVDSLTSGKKRKLDFDDVDSKVSSKWCKIDDENHNTKVEVLKSESIKNQVKSRINLDLGTGSEDMELEINDASFEYSESLEEGIHSQNNQIEAPIYFNSTEVDHKKGILKDETKKLDKENTGNRFKKVQFDLNEVKLYSFPTVNEKAFPTDYVESSEEFSKNNLTLPDSQVNLSPNNPDNEDTAKDIEESLNAILTEVSSATIPQISSPECIIGGIIANSNENNISSGSNNVSSEDSLRKDAAEKLKSLGDRNPKAGIFGSGNETTKKSLHGFISKTAPSTLKTSSKDCNYNNFSKTLHLQKPSIVKPNTSTKTVEVSVPKLHTDFVQNVINFPHFFQDYRNMNEGSIVPAEIVSAYYQFLRKPQPVLYFQKRLRPEPPIISLCVAREVLYIPL